MGAERLAAWRSGARVNIPWGEPHRLRITRAGNVETSLGVVIPSAEAREAWPKLKFARQRGGLLYGPHNVSPGDIRLAGFRLDRMDDEGTVYAGCHRLAWSEIEAVGEQLTAMK